MPEDFQWTFTRGAHSVTFGLDTDLIVRSVEGLDGYDQLRSSTVTIPRGHGGIPGQHYAGVRYPTFRLLAAADSVADMPTLRDQVMQALAPSTSEDGTLDWITDGMSGTRRLYCRPLVVSWPLDGSRSARLSEAAVTFEAADPRIYSVAGKQVSLDAFSTSGGVNDPVNDPKNVTVSGSDVAVTNDGNTGAPPVIRFYGPTSGTCTGVQLTNRTTGVQIDVQTDIVAGQILTIDVRAFLAATGARVIDLSGSSRYGSWQQTREALLIEPGSNLLRFTADGITTGMSCRVDFADTWLN